MKTILCSSRLVRLFATLALPTLAFTACEVKKTQEGELPKVNVEGGQVPKYDVKGPEVKVEEKTIKVPDIDIVTPKEKREGGNVELGDPKPVPAPVPPAR